MANKEENGNTFFIPNRMDIDSKGNIFFANSSSESPYTIQYGRKLILEMKPTAGLYHYNPSPKEIRTLIDGTYFGNGVVILKDECFL